MKKKKKQIIIFSVIVLVAILMSLTPTIAKYAKNVYWNYYLQSKGFYFNSDFLAFDSKHNDYNSWTGESITFNVRNSQNDVLVTDYDISYKATCKIVGVEASYAKCLMNGSATNVWEGSLPSSKTCTNDTGDSVDVSGYSKTECELGGYTFENHTVSSELYFDVVLTDPMQELSEFIVNVEVESTTPYKKVLIGDFAIKKAMELALNINKKYSDHGEYGKLIVSNPLSNMVCVNIKWNSEELLIDEEKENFNEYKIDANGYLTEIQLYINESSSIDYNFYKKNTNRVFQIEDFTVTACKSSESVEYVKEGLVLYYEAANNTGDGYSSDTHIWKDLIGNNDGVLAGNPMWGNGYLNFDGIDDKVRFIGDLPLNYTIVITFEPTFNNVTNWQRLFSENPFPSLYVNNASGIRNLRLYGHGIDNVFPNSTIEEEKMQVAITFDGNNIELYIDGLLISNLKSTSNPTSVPIACLGGRIIDNNRQFQGKIYNFLMYDRVLEKKEIQYNNYVENVSKIIKIDSIAELFKIGSDEIIEKNGVEYTFTADKTYIVSSNFSFDYDGLWYPNINEIGSIDTGEYIITVRNTNDSSLNYYRHQQYVTAESAIKDGLVLHYDAINNTGSGHSNSTLVWKDLIGNNNGNLVSGPSWGDNKLTFDGIDDKVSYRGDITPEYSIAITIKPVLSGNYPRLFAEYTYPTVYLHSVNSYQFGFYSPTADRVFSPSLTPSTTKYTYVVLTYAAGKATLYVDGAEIGFVNSSGAPVQQALAYIGGRSSNDRQYKGEITNYMIYNRVLTSREIFYANMYNQERYP